MDKDILKGVIEVEEEIKQRLAAEQEKAEKWLAQVRQEAEQEVLAKEHNLKEDLKKTADSTQSQARAQAEEIINNARVYSDRLKNISDDTLKKIITEHLPRILPGG